MSGQELKVDLNICGWNGNPYHCVYLAERRIAGEKPWGGGKSTKLWSIPASDVANAIKLAGYVDPELARMAAEIEVLKAQLIEATESADDHKDKAEQREADLHFLKGDLDEANAEVERLRANQVPVGFKQTIQDFMTKAAMTVMLMQGTKEFREAVSAYVDARDNLTLILNAPSPVQE